MATTDSLEIEPTSDQAVQILKEESEYYRSLFESAPVALMDEDLSDVKRSIDALKAQGIHDFQTYFKEHPDAVRQHYELIKKEVTINEEFVRVYRANSKEQLLNELDDTVITEHSLNTFQKLFVALADGKTRFSTTSTDMGVDGHPVRVRATWVIAPGFEDTWGRIIVAAMPI